MMQINSELHTQLETLQEELTRTKQAKNKAEETLREMEAAGGVKQTEEVKKLKTALQEMGRVVKYLETELQKSQEYSNSDTKELATKLMQEREKNQEMEQKISCLQQSSLQGNNEDSIKTAAQKTVAEKDKVIQEMMDKLKRAEESLQSQSVNVEVQKSTIRHLEEKCGKLQQSNQGELVKKYEGNLRAAQMQINKLQQCLQVASSKDREGILQKFNASQNQVTNLLTTLKNNEARWKSQEEAVSRQFNEKIKYAQDNVSKLQVALEEKNKLELWNLEKIRTLEESLVLKETIIVKQEEKLLTVSQIELSVKNLEDELTELNNKLKMSEEENKRLSEESALKEIAVKESFMRMEAQLTLAEQTKIAIENKKLEVDKHVRDLETKYTEVEEELEDTKQRLSEMESDCSEAVQKYKDLHEQKIVGDSNLEKCQQDCDQLKKSYEEEVHKYSLAIGIKSRYEYQMNLLEEKCRNIGDISVKLKELKDQFGELQIEKNNVQDQLKEATDKEKLYIETVSCKDAEIVSLNKVLEAKNQSSSEIVLPKESEDGNSNLDVEAVKKEMLEKESHYQQELANLQLENVKIKEQLVALSVAQELNGQKDEEKTNIDVIAKYKMDLAESTIQIEALKAENIEMNRKLNELIVKDKNTEALKLELDNVRLKLKEFENMSIKSDERMSVGSWDNAEQDEILKTLQSMSINKRKRVLENLYEETKKGRLRNLKRKIWILYLIHSMLTVKLKLTQ